MQRAPGRKRRRYQREDGAVAVEAAIVVPLLCLLVFGMIEFAFVMRDYASVSSMTRTGARIASTGAGAGPGVCDPDPTAPPCTPASSPALAQAAADAIQRSGAVADPQMINYILIYKANKDGFPGADGNKTMPADCSATANCVKFTWRPALSQFRYSSGSWDSKNINACFPSAIDRVGVYMDADHQMITGLFGDNIDLKDRAVMDFEPLKSDSCHANDHQ